MILACKPVPDQYIPQAKIDASYRNTGDSLVFDFHNTLHCPIRINLTRADSVIQDLVDPSFPLFLAAKADTSFYFLDSLPQEARCGLSFTLWTDPPSDSTLPQFTWPFPRGRSYSIIQGYNGSFSHQRNYSRFALDFDLSVGDTICAAGAGYVVGVIEGYQHGGNNRKWRPYANTVTIYHPEQATLTQYAHLIKNGALVEVGDTVQTGQAIGISGKTGFTSTPHLHFNVLRAVNGHLISHRAKMGWIVGPQKSSD
ncbi:MAG: M23 family metallopeptidase [Bacteroidota bacterium]